MSLARLGTLKVIDEARARIDMLAVMLEHELAAAYSALDACRAALAAEKTATASWRARCLDAEHALARRWAAAVHLSASDNGNRVPTKPAFLDGDDEAWATAWWNGVDVFTVYDASGNPSFVAGDPYDGGDPDLARAGGLVQLGDIPPGWAISIEETRPNEAATVRWVAACPRGKAKGGAR